MALWYLEGFVDDDKRFRRIPIVSLPFRLGRGSGVDGVLTSTGVSRVHAELIEKKNDLWVRDLGSTNGTFVNSEQVTDENRLTEGDILHFATLELRVGRLATRETRALLGTTTRTAVGRLPSLLVDRILRFRRMLESQSLAMLLQPIVVLGEEDPMGYEILLGGSELEGFAASGPELFEMSTVLSAEVDLSILCRQQSLPWCQRLAHAQVDKSPPSRFFFNTHPAELKDAHFYESLQTTREEAPDLPMAVEIHEGAVTNAFEMRELKARLLDFDMNLVYDDFGAGRARLNELAEAPPDYLKFDIALIHGIDTAPLRKKKLIAGLVGMAKDLEIETVAEGVETAAEAETCRELGFEMAQGFYFARPAPIEDFLESD